MTELQKPDKQSLSLYTFTFVVMAASELEAKSYLKQELGIDKEVDSSYREIKGVYVAMCILNKSILTKSFYKKIEESVHIAIHKDGMSESLYPEILSITHDVEQKLRLLLLHIYDTVDNFKKLINADTNQGLIHKGRYNPITSDLSFDGLIGAFSQNLSWTEQGINSEKVELILKENPTADKIALALRQSITKSTVWDKVATIVLKKDTSWSNVSGKISKLKAYRDTCAHGRTITPADLQEARILKSKVLEIIDIKKKLTAKDLRLIGTLNNSIVNSIKLANESYAKTFNSLLKSSLATQKSLASLAGTAVVPSAEITKNIAKSVNEMYKPIFQSDFYKIMAGTNNNLNNLQSSKLFQQSLLESVKASTKVTPDVKKAIQTLQGLISPDIPKTQFFTSQIMNTNKFYLDLIRTLSTTNENTDRQGGAPEDSSSQAKPGKKK